MSDVLQLLVGDCRKMLPTLDAESVQCCVTSPPYWGQRDYGYAGQIGLEAILVEANPEYVSLARERVDGMQLGIC